MIKANIYIFKHSLFLSSKYQISWKAIFFSQLMIGHAGSAFLWKNKGCLIHKRTLISRLNVCWLRIEGFKNQINMLSTKNWFIATLLVNFLSLFEYYHSNTNFLVIKITFNLVFSFLGILLYSCSSVKEEINGILWTYLIEKKGF